MKKTVAFVVALSIFGASVLSALGADTKTELTMQIDNPIMKVNGTEAEIDPGESTAPVIVNDTTLVPIRAIIEALGGTVEWNGDTREVTLKQGENTLLLTIDSKTALKNGKEEALETAPAIINERTMLPVRFVSESIGFKVDWDGDTRTIKITDEETPATAAPTTTETPAATTAPTATETPAATTAPTTAPQPSVVQKDGENLFNYKYTENKTLDITTGVEKDATKYILSDYIEVVPGTKYAYGTFNPKSGKYEALCKAYAYYDADKAFISAKSALALAPVTAPEKAAYIRIAIAPNAILTDLERLARYTVFAKSNAALTDFVYPDDLKTTDKFAGKKICLYGDDFVTNGSNWINILEKNLGVSIYEVCGNRYFGSSTKSRLSELNNINLIPADSEYILVYGGMYDWMNNYPIGEVNGVDSGTTAEGVKILDSRLKEKYPTAQVIYLTPVACHAFGRGTIMADGMKNSRGLSIDDYAVVISEQATSDGMKVFDANKNCGITQNNISQYIPKVGNLQTYPNADGAKLLGEYILNELLK